MKQFITFFIVLNGAFGYAQDSIKLPIYVLLDSNNHAELYQFKKSNSDDYANVKVLRYADRDKGFEKQEIDYTSPQPNKPFMEFKSQSGHKTLKTIENLKIWDIIDLSKAKIWNNTYPYTICFVEKKNSNEYVLWKMDPVIME